jgi:hypothetical protein
LLPSPRRSIFRAASDKGAAMSKIRYREADGAYDLDLPAGWQMERDAEDGGLLISAEDGVGLLHLISFDREPEEETDPAEELYAFLEDQEIEIEEDEVDDFELEGSGAIALCEYLAEEEDEVAFWMVGVATAKGQLIFASYSCPSGEEEKESVVVRDILASIAFKPRA